MSSPFTRIERGLAELSRAVQRIGLGKRRSRQAVLRAMLRLGNTGQEQEIRLEIKFLPPN